MLAAALTIHALVRTAVAQASSGQFSAPQPRNIQGELLVLDASSLTFRGNHPIFAGITSAADCADACAKLPGCNSYNWCGSKSGCGSGCKAYVKQHAQLKGDPGGQLKAVSLPVLSYGPWPQPYGADGCQFVPTGQWPPTTTDAWSFGTCSLKRQRYPSSPAYAKGPGEGWVSGAASLPTACAGLSLKACEACLSSQQPADCLACAKDPRAAGQPAVSYLQTGGKLQQGCALCANVASAAHRRKCIACVLGQLPCDYCVYGSTMYGPVSKPQAIPSCLDCVARHGNGFRGGCSACSQSPNSARCFQCLASFPLKTCPDGQITPFGAPKVCWSPTDKTPCDICVNAAKSDAAYSDCLSCFRTGGAGRDECQACTWLTDIDAASQSRCFKCVPRAGFTEAGSAGCAPCFYQWVGAGSRDACLACVESKATPPAAKGQCAWCVGNGKPQDKAMACVACLGAQKSPYGYNSCNN